MNVTHRILDKGVELPLHKRPTAVFPLRNNATQIATGIVPG